MRGIRNREGYDGEDFGPPRVMRLDNLPTPISGGRVITLNDVRPLVIRDLILLDW